MKVAEERGKNRSDLGRV
jgi:hypothetical protein